MGAILFDQGTTEKWAMNRVRIAECVAALAGEHGLISVTKRDHWLVAMGDSLGSNALKNLVVATELALARLVTRIGEEAPDDPFGLPGSHLDPVGASVASDCCAPLLRIVDLLDLADDAAAGKQRTVVVPALDTPKQALDPFSDHDWILHSFLRFGVGRLTCLSRVGESADKRKLEREVAELRAENEELRSKLRVEPQPTDDDPAVDAPRPVRVLLLPDPNRQPEGDGPGPKAVANLARVLVDQLQRRQPANEWRAEFDLERIPPETPCYQLGAALARLWDGTGPLPATFVVVKDEEGAPRLERRLVPGEPASARFQEGYRGLLGDVNDLLDEGQAAHDAGAHHHANWAIKAADVILVRLKLAWILFEEGGNDWLEILAEGRPEYEPRGALP